MGNDQDSLTLMLPHQFVKKRVDPLESEQADRTSETSSLQ